VKPALRGCVGGCGVEEGAEMADGCRDLGGGGAAEAEDETGLGGLLEVVGGKWPEPKRFVDGAKGEFAIIQGFGKRDREVHAGGVTGDVNEGGHFTT
jgi:hypothetical protein